VAKRTAARFNSSVTTTAYFDHGNMSLFMGGDNATYSSDHDEYHLTDNYSWFTVDWYFGEGGDMPLGYDITDMLEAIDTFHDN